MKMCSKFVGASSLLLSATSFAGGDSVSVVVSAEGAGAVGVPGLTGGVIAVLALLLAVVALRFTKDKSALVKSVVTLAVGAGVALMGTGVKELHATGESISAESSACSGGSEIVSNTRPTSSGNTLENRCESTNVVIGEWNDSCQNRDSFFVLPAGSETGTVLAPHDTIQMGYCDRLGDT
ncbi:MAG: hypothetical protein AAGI11_20020 [Pseudomonadota bacterium]